MKMRYLSVILLLLSLIAVSCTHLPRDEIALYETGIRFWKNGDYEMAVKALAQFSEVDSLYLPLHLLLIDSYYNLADEQRLKEALDRAYYIFEDELIFNLTISLTAKNLQSWGKETRISFFQFIEDVSNKHGIDPGLIFAIINQQSGYLIDFEDDSGRAGLLGLSIKQARLFGLEVGNESLHRDFPHTFPDNTDERFNPVSSINKSVAFLSELIERYRFGTKSSNLVDALYSFYTPNEEEFQTYDVEVSNVINLFQQYRRNFYNQELSLQRFYEQNRVREVFFSLPERITYKEYDELSLLLEENEKFLEGTSRSHFQGYYYNNLALVFEMLNEPARAEEYYLRAETHSPTDEVVLFNLGLFYYNQERYREANAVLRWIESKDSLVLQGYISVLESDVGRLAEIINELTVLGYEPAELANLRGLYFYLLEDEELTLNNFRDAAKKSSENEYAVNYLATLYKNVFPGEAIVNFRLSQRVSGQFKTDYDWPVDLRYISSYYGWRPNPFRRSWRERLNYLDFHNGIDIPGRIGVPVRAAADGIVERSAGYPMGGETVFLQHPDGYITTYLHLETRLVAEGETVKQGDVIGLLGNTGYSTGPHLHFGMFNHLGETVNPLLYLPVY